jgi:hypothetical protein
MKTMMISMAAAIATILFAIGPMRWCADSITTQSLSPDDTYRIYLTESKPNLPLTIDRNFKLSLAILDKDDKHEIARETLYISPDEGKPIGSERFIWSKDSKYVLLVGKHFFVATDLQVGHDEQAYFLYHAPSKRSWCNSQQAKGKHGILTEDELREIDFEQPISPQLPVNLRR